MSVAVGVLCSDGVVVGSDSAAVATDSSAPIAGGPTRKTFVVGKDLLLAGSGPAGLLQRFRAIAGELREDSRFPELHPRVIVRDLSAATLDDFAATKAAPGQLGAVAAFVTATGPHLCEFARSDFQPELKSEESPTASAGEGRAVVDALLGLIARVWFPGRLPTLDEGRYAVCWALHHAQQLGAAGVRGPLQMAVLRRELPELPMTGHLLSAEEIDRQLQRVAAAERHLAEFARELGGGSR